MSPVSLQMPLPQTPEQERKGFMPSASTGASALGGALATLIMAWYHASHHVDFSPETGIALGVICTTLAGYLPQSGRR